MSHSPGSQPSSAWPVHPKPCGGHPPNSYTSHCKEPASWQELAPAQGDRDSRSRWPYLFPEEQDLLREYLGEALWCEERERLEAGEDLPVLLQDSLREPGLSGELWAGEGRRLRLFSSEEPRHEDRHAL